MPADYFADMESILKAMNSTIKVRRGQSTFKQLQAVKTFKVGVLAPATVFPAIALLPESERVMKWYSGNQALVERVFSVECFTKGTDFSRMRDLATAILETCLDLYKQDFTLSSIETGGYKKAFNIEIGSIEYDRIEGERSPILISRATVSFLNKEEIDISPEVAGTLINDPSMDSISDEIKRRLFILRKDKLQGVKYIYVDPPEISLKFPAIRIKQEIGSEEKYEAGRNRVKKKFTISVLSKMIPKSSAIYTVMYLVEQVKYVLHKYATWGDRCITSNILGIDYALEEGTSGYLYSARIDYETESIRNSVFI